VQRISIADSRWRDFVTARADATPFHEPAWASLLGECYAMDVFALVEIDESDRVRAGTPVAAAPRLPGRPRRLVSLPFTDALAPLVDPPEERRFAEAADSFRRAQRLARIEFRGGLDGARAGLAAAVIHTLPLDGGPEALLDRFSKGKRRDVRAADRQALTARHADAEHDLTETFYRLHLETRRRHGVPVQPKRFFKLLWRRILEPGHGFALIAEDAGVPIAGAVFIVGHGRIVYKYSASDVSRRNQLSTDLLIWTAIQKACGDGLRAMDFGRSEVTAEGLRAFKSRWGAVEEPLVYSAVGDGADTGGSGTPGLAASMLRRSPKFVTRAVGELLYRYAA
jgi:CelD/BcsL family acetyltransferase involved in cellulose biosynthesis